MTRLSLAQRQQQIQQIVVTAAEMRQVEARIFAAGMPVAALMEKVAIAIAQRIAELYPAPMRVGVLVGSGHNGGDGLVVARELHFRGYPVSIYCPSTQLKELTGYHANYCQSLGIPFVDQVAVLQDCDLLVDALFGIGLDRELSTDLVAIINRVNTWMKPVVSIDLPSGLHTDTGQALGSAIQATHTLCLGLWKQGLLQDQALKFVGKAELIDFDVPLADVWAVVGESPKVRRITLDSAIAHLPLQRSATAHKYTMGHLLVVCGSRQYAGAAILAGLGARASGVGMLSIAVPESIKPILTAQIPEALIVGCSETESGAIAHIPINDLEPYNAIACGPGLTSDAGSVVQRIVASDRPLLLDADGLNYLASVDPVTTLQPRSAATILTPHWGEFKRLFPDLAENPTCRITTTQQAATQTGAIVLLKGARTIISDSHTTWINSASTPALARGGSGDVFTGLLGGLLAQHSASDTQHPAPDTSSSPLTSLVQSATWWHAQAGILAAQERSELGVDAYTLTQYLSQIWQTL
ncbi:MAG: bifunctional ADP-dependent NAD(P)H-hydrate dehydratase/NAD(P)H-hydrate epimerase [Leptolyngbya sp.]|nr:MAG: bifunctional ADP-dependent NAD(P)H-hydrate dehydratase/NAD(P)H-hydrate epimerase [Leptolyngbya sp.]